MGQAGPRRARRRRRVRAVPALGRLPAGRRRQADVPWPCDAENKYIAHFPETREIWSYGSGYGGNALLGKKCFALRIASTMARDDGWMAEHMLILGVTPPDGREEVRRRRLPVGLRQDQHGHADPDPPGLEGRDRRRRHRLDEVRRRRPALRHQPRGRLLRRGPGHLATRPTPTPCATLGENSSSPTWPRPTTATSGGRAWPPPPAHLIDWKGKDWTPESDGPGRPPQRPLHRPGRRSARRSPPSGRTPTGVPISAILFGGRRATNVPLVTEAFDWEHGVFLGSIMSSEKTAAAAGTVGEVRFDPFAMLPVLRLQHGRLLQPLARASASTPPTPRSCPGSSGSTGSARATTARSCGRASATTAGCSSGSSSASTARSTPSTRPSAGCPPPRTSTSSGLDIDPATVEPPASTSTPRPGAGGPPDRGALRLHRRAPARRAPRRAPRAREAPRRPLRVEISDRSG